MTLRPAGYRHYAADLAKHGYSAFLVHYFDRTSEEKLGEMNQANDLQLRRKVLADMRLVGSSRWLGAGK